MYTSYIGLKFLELYNRRTGRELSAFEFFEREMYPQFFDDARHLMHVSNSPFFQTPSKKDLQESGLSKSAFQYQNLIQKVSLVTESGTANADASIYVGFAANGPDQSTAGQVSNIDWEITTDEIYASWIGNALAIRVEGSQCLLLDSEPVLWHLFEGWRTYRDYIQPIDGMKGRQIETWNGYWLARGETDKAISPPQKAGSLETIPWIEVIAKLLTWHSGESLPTYVFSMGQTNTTYGFMNIQLPEIGRLNEARFAVKRTFLSLSNEDEREFWKHYETELSLREVCQLGEIGLRGLRPRDFGKLIDGNFATTKINNKNNHSFSNILTWILAMLNNKSDLQKMAAALATELVAAESSGKAKERGKTTDTTDVKNLFEAKGLTTFITALTDFLERRLNTAEVCRAVVDETIRIPIEQFPLFKALLRFEYVYRKSNKQ